MPTGQLDFVDTLPNPNQEPLVLPEIQGLSYVEDFLSEREQSRTLRTIDGAPWRNDLQRRVQHYGWRYDYESRSVTHDMELGPLPPWLQSLASRLCEAGMYPQPPDQAIVNEYLPGQGIAMHVDRKCFGPVVATISLGDAWHMDLRPTGRTPGRVEQVLLRAGSVLALSGDARYQWMHGIAPRKKERVGDGWRHRERRVSVTFRTVLLDE